MTIEENKDRIINGFMGMQENIQNLEINKVSNEELVPVAKAAYQDYPVWTPETQYKIGDMVYVTDINKNHMTARTIKDHISASVTSEMNPRNWITDWKAGNIQIIATLDAGSTGNINPAQITGYALDAGVVNGEISTIRSLLGDWTQLDEELKFTGQSANDNIEVVNILLGRIKALEAELSGVSAKITEMTSKI